MSTPNGFENTLRGYSNKDLLKMIQHPQDYEDEAMSLCRKEIERRGGLSAIADTPEQAAGLKKKESEPIIAIIGQKYSTSLLSGAGFSKTSLVLTNRTLSGVGKTYTAKSKGIVSFSGNVKNISSLGIEYTSNWIFLLLGLVLLLAWGLGIIFLILYFVQKERYIIVNFQGALYALSLRGISNQDVQVFIEKSLEVASAG